MRGRKRGALDITKRVRRTKEEIEADKFATDIICQCSFSTLTAYQRVRVYNTLADHFTNRCQNIISIIDEHEARMCQ